MERLVEGDRIVGRIVGESVRGTVFRCGVAGVYLVCWDNGLVTTVTEKFDEWRKLSFVERLVEAMCFWTWGRKAGVS